MTLTIAIILGSVRENRQGIKAAKFIEKHLKERKHKTILLDPLDLKIPLLKKRYKNYPKGKAPNILTQVHKQLLKADAYIIVSAEYNHSIPPALSNILDHFYEEYFYKPAGICTYSAGSFGGIRAGIQLRSMLGELGMVTIHTMFPISTIQEALDEQGNATETRYNDRIQPFLNELEWYAQALQEARKKGTPNTNN